MKPVLMFVTSWCPHCRNAAALIDKLRSEHMEYRDVEIKVVDEEKERQFAKNFDYYFVPTFFVDGEKVHEGVPSLSIIQNVFEKAMK